MGHKGFELAKNSKVKSFTESGQQSCDKEFKTAEVGLESIKQNSSTPGAQS